MLILHGRWSLLVLHLRGRTLLVLVLIAAVRRGQWWLRGEWGSRPSTLAEVGLGSSCLAVDSRRSTAGSTFCKLYAVQSCGFQLSLPVKCWLAVAWEGFKLRSARLLDGRRNDDAWAWEGEPPCNCQISILVRAVQPQTLEFIQCQCDVVALPSFSHGHRIGP